LSAGNLLGDVN